ncbi:hypothetical protein AOLI_G00142860 [Acnodon oligacanthus]
MREWSCARGALSREGTGNDGREAEEYALHLRSLSDSIGEQEPERSRVNESLNRRFDSLNGRFERELTHGARAEVGSVTAVCAREPLARGSRSGPRGGSSSARLLNVFGSTDVSALTAPRAAQQGRFKGPGCGSRLTIFCQRNRRTREEK